MKKYLQISIIVFILAASGLNVQSQQNSFTTGSGKTVLKRSADQRSDSPKFVQGEITIKLREGVGEFGAQSGMVRFGIHSLDEKAANFEVNKLEKRFRYNPAKMRAELPDISRIYKISFPGHFSLTEVVKSFSSDPNVEYAEPVPVRHTVEVSNDSLFYELQHLPQIYAEEAWAIHKGEAGSEAIVIAIVDTGVDWDHEDLHGNTWQNLMEDADGDGHTKEYNGTEWVLDPGDLNGVDDDLNGFTDDLLGWNFINGNGDPNPIPGNFVGYHGTHCAGISNASTDNGTGIASISWNLQFMGICTDENNTLPYGWDGVIYAAENGADIISNSWGGGTYSIAEQEVVNYAYGLGSIFIAAAGNNYNSVLFYPADYQNSISVASVSVDDTKADYSCFNAAVDISAPGGGYEGGILSTVPGNGYELASGTSMATPLVAGCLGLLKSYHPDWTNEQLITQLLGTADDIDSLNPGYENMLGTGRVNAFRLMSEENVSMPQELKIGITSLIFEDANGNQINEAGEQVTLNIEFGNFVSFVGEDSVTVTLTTDDPDINILFGSATVNIPPDGLFTLDSPFQFEVAANASSHFGELAIHFESVIPVTVGQDITFQALVAPSGVLVYEGLANGQDYSGTFITEHLDLLGYNYTYSNTFVSLLGFEAVFLSFGNYESYSTILDNQMADAIADYLDAGGYVYLEGGDALGWDQANNSYLLELFGLISTTDGGTNPINSLQGLPDAITYEMLFTGNSQSSNSYIDKLVPANNAVPAFFESGYGYVAVQHAITDSHRSFCFSYSLAYLNDGETPNTREELLNRILNFFDINTSVPDLAGSDLITCNIYPNPMQNHAVFQYYLPEASQVNLEIYNSAGRIIKQIQEGYQVDGNHQVQWNAEELPAGIYYYSLNNGKQVLRGKFVIVK